MPRSAPRRPLPARTGTPGRRHLAAVGLAAAALALSTLGLPATGPRAAQAAGSAAMGSTLVPRPALVRPDPAAGYPLTTATAITTDAGSAEAARTGTRLAELLRPATGYPLPVRTAGAADAPADGIALLLTGADPSVGPEGYQLDVTATGVVIRAAQPQGLFNAVQTLRQLLPAAIESATAQPGPWTVPGGHIVDHPRYPYRGAMLDVARHFFTVAEVERHIDGLARYKINHLHLHLTDDQGWRIAVDGRPELTSIGGSTQVGGGPGGYYTQDDYRTIVAYAAAQNITVVPEVDLPGHINAALAATPELNCDGKAPPLYTGTDVGFSSLCLTTPAARAAAEAFVDDVVGELAALTPGPYLAIGGDEAHTTDPGQYADFMTWVQQDVARHGKTATAWNQITGATLQPSTLVEDWDTTGDNPALAAAAAHGTGLILAPARFAYLDQKYTADTVLGQSWAAPSGLDVRTAYDWDPDAYVQGAPAAAVRGVEAPLWTETAATPQDLDHLSNPRLPTLAELGWSPAAAHDFTDFARRIATHGPRWELLGIRYHRSPQIPWPAAPTAPTGPTGPVTAGTGRTCLTATGAADGSPVDNRSACNGTPAQTWTLGDDGTLRALGKCLDATGGGTANGTPVQLWSCNGTGSQTWQWAFGAGPALRNPRSGRCLDTTASGGLRLYECSATTTQVWHLP
ncbi:family 20 glycosylhydrolase [Streptomyces sp. NRRL B-24484]|uniref:family 20 glycosylhydrolase n=1 Tax=Streptomyces sp. NRRL B-24484 TaxID=1463833 RepID=UPI0007C45117|nr:beta-N-acetylhexosaminidase [Streptomyces sp. NRRL B-24484]